jgi:hypothetical protein
MPPAEFTRSPQSFLVWAEQRDGSAHLAADLACALDRQFEWIEIRESATADTPWEKALLDRIGPSRVHRTLVGQMAPDRSGGNVALWMAFKDRAGEPALEYTSRFATLPEPVRNILSRTDPDGPTRGLVIAHADRAAHQYPENVGTLRPYLDVLKRSNVSPVFVYGRAPRPNAADFDVVIHLWTDSGDRTEQVTIERGAPALESILRGRTTLSLEEFLSGWRTSS